MKIVYVKGKATAEDNSIEKIDVKHKSFKDWYPLLDCNTFDVASRKIGGREFSIYCDDEGLFKSDNAVSLITEDYDGNIVERLVGNLAICKIDDNGKTCGLSEEEQDLIVSSTAMYFDRDRGRFAKVIVASI